MFASIYAYWENNQFNIKYQLKQDKYGDSDFEYVKSSKKFQWIPYVDAEIAFRKLMKFALNTMEEM
jgi:hypothetical protein